MNITRASAKEDNKSSVNTLKTLTLSESKIDFKSSTTKYDVNVLNEVTKIKIKSTLTDSKSSYVNGFGDNEEVTLKEGKNEILIKVKAENGDVKTYTVNIIREASVKEDIVVDITIDNYVIDFNKDVLEYDVRINDEINLNFNVTLSNSDYSYQIIGNNNLINGSVVTVSATGNNETIEYKFNIIKQIIVDNEDDVNNNENNDNNKNNNITYLSIGFLVTSIAILISTIVYVVWKNRKTKMS